MDTVENTTLLIPIVYVVCDPIFSNLGHREVLFADNFLLVWRGSSE